MECSSVEANICHAAEHTTGHPSHIRHTRPATTILHHPPVRPPRADNVDSPAERLDISVIADHHPPYKSKAEDISASSRYTGRRSILHARACACVGARGRRMTARAEVPLAEVARAAEHDTRRKDEDLSTPHSEGRGVSRSFDEGSTPEQQRPLPRRIQCCPSSTPRAIPAPVAASARPARAIAIRSCDGALARSLLSTPTTARELSAPSA
jgi:hypothetical protein